MTARPDRTWIVSAAACAAAAFVLFQFWGNSTHGYIATNSLFYWWGFQWINPESETEHAWLILGLSIFLLYRNLRREKEETKRETPLAAVLLLGGLALHAMGYVAEQPRLSIVALLLVIWGALTLGGGSRWRKASGFPLGFMVFAIPVNALDTVGFWLRMWVVRAGEMLAHGIGIGVIRNGTQLFAPDGRYQYDVVAACSGVRSLMALTSLSLFFGYILFQPAWLRAAMLLLSLPLVYLGNVLRIFSIIAAAQWRGQAFGDRVHDWMGFGVFFVVVGGVIGLGEFIAGLRPGWTTDGASRVPHSPADGRAGLSPAALAVVVGLAAAADAAYLAHRASLPADERAGVILASDGRNPVELPTFLGSDWMGTAVAPTPIERAILPPDTGYSTKVYTNMEGPGQRVLLSIVLSGRDRTSIHRPELCLVGQGWTIEGSHPHAFTYPGRGGMGFDATVLEVRRRSPEAPGTWVPELVVYWFVGGDRIVPSMGKRMLFDAWNRLARGRADRWAYVLLQTGADDGEAAGLARIQSVLNSALPSFQPANRSD